MKRVSGLGGVFFNVKDPDRMYAWYEKHLGLQKDEGSFRWGGAELWAAFPSDSQHFGIPVRMNFIVEDLDALLKVLEQEGVAIEPERESHEYGRFAWITDVEGNRVELWEPPGAE